MSSSSSGSYQPLPYVPGHIDHQFCRHLGKTDDLILNQRYSPIVLGFFLTVNYPCVNMLALSSEQVGFVIKACFFHLRRIRQIRRYLYEHCLHVLVQALVLSPINYCNSVLYLYTGHPSRLGFPLKSVHDV